MLVRTQQDEYIYYLEVLLVDEFDLAVNERLP
jgi:hypothetical protein